MNVIKEGTVKGLYPKEINVLPKSELYVTIPVEVNIDHIGKTVIEIITNKDTFKYGLAIDGTIELTNSKKGPSHIHLTKEGTLELVK
jgi:LEA14-like dessication related protein